MRAPWLWAVVSACSDNHFSYPIPPAECVPSAVPAEPADLQLDAEKWQLRTRWQTTTPVDGSWIHEIGSAAFADTDGDGQIGTGDRMDIVASDAVAHRVSLFDGETGELVLSIYGDEAVIADVDPARPGPELLISAGGNPVSVSIADRGGVYAEHEIPERGEYAYEPSMVDLDGDGTPEWVGKRGVYDFPSGTLRFSFPEYRADVAVSADMDGDGRTELIVPLGRHAAVTVFAADGTMISRCPPPDRFPWGDDWGAIAVGNLDADPELELVSGTVRGIRICDLDGTVVAESDLPAYGGLSIAQLDADPEPELVTGLGSQILALEHDLSPMVASPPLLALGRSFSVADFDDDGIHEALASTGSVLSVTRTTGTPWVWEVFDARNSPFSLGYVSMVADLDADGLAEIVVPSWEPAQERSGVAVFDNPLGGWRIHGADAPWGTDPAHGPSISPSGQLTPPGPDAFVGGDNVWNGRPIAPSTCHVTIGLDIRDVCVARCDDDATVTVYVSHRGVVPLPEPLSVEIWSRGERVGAAPVPFVAPEQAVPVRLVVPARDLSGPIEARLSGGLPADCATPVAVREAPVCLEDDPARTDIGG